MNRRIDDVTGWGYSDTRNPESGSVVDPAPTLTASWWPFQSRLELGALPSAVPSARLHARLVIGEWGHEPIADTVELVVSELVTNGVKAVQNLENGSTVRLELSGDETRVLVAVRDDDPEPVHALALDDDELPDLEAEGGRGLFLVTGLSADWGMYRSDDALGKVVWCLLTAPEADDVGTEPYRRRAHWQLPKRVPSAYPIQRPAHPMGDVGVLKRVREGLRNLT